METTLIERLKENLAGKRRAITDWLNSTSPQAREIRIGPQGEPAMQQELRTIDEALARAEQDTLGVCEICHESVEESLLEMDYTASVCITHLSGEQRERLESELELSAKVQQALLPHRVPEIRGMEIAAFSQPAHIVGGDYFDFLRFDDGAHAIVIADVMGKGMPASMLMASLQASLRIIAPESRHPAEVVSRLNRLFCHNIRLTKFVSLFLGRYDEKTGVLTYCNAGHNPPLVRKETGSFELLRPTGAAIGLAEQTEFSEGSIALHAGDRLLFYTDGVVEARDGSGEEFGMARLESLLDESKGITSRQIVGLLREKVGRFSGATTPADDTTFIVARMQTS